MATPTPLTSSEYLVLLCRWLCAGNDRRRFDEHFATFYKALERPFFRYLLPRLRFDEHNAKDEFHKLMQLVVSRVTSRTQFAEEVDALLQFTNGCGSDQILLKSLSNWRHTVRKVLARAMRLPFDHQTLSPPALEQTAIETNEALTAACSEGADLFWRFAHDTARPRTVGESLHEDALLSEGARDIDNLFRPVVKAELHLRRAVFMTRWTELDTSGAPDLQDLLFNLGQEVFMLARVRLPMFAYLYRAADSLAKDRLRADSKVLLADDLKRADGASDHADHSESVDATDNLEGVVTDEFTPKRFIDQETINLLHDIEASFAQALRRLKAQLAAARSSADRSILQDKLDKEVLRVRQMKTVFELQILGHTQELIAEMLQLTRDQVRTALGHISTALDGLKPNQ